MRFVAVASLVLIACVPNGRGDRRQTRAKDAGPAAEAGQPSPDSGATDSGIVAPNDAGEPGLDSGVTLPDAGDICIEGPQKRERSNVFFGTDLPTYVPLTAGQITAIGDFNGCSGLLIAQTWVLTAQHCGLDSTAEFCIGTAPNSPNVCVGVTRAISHPSADLTLVELDQPAANLLPGVEPVPLLTESLDQTWVGRMAEAAGYGQDENGGSGRREFTAEPIYEVAGDFISIDGQGAHGVCFGDSGGPVMVIASDGSARVAGALSYGDESCVGVDNFTRVDLYRSWIEGYTGPTIPPGPQPCGSVTVEGSCSADRRRATWCGPNDELAIESCDSSKVCGWSEAEMAWRCIDNALDPCGGLNFDGACDSNVLRWCDRGQLFERDCPSCGETCLPAEQGGFLCVPSNCGDVDYLGKCQGNTAVWCNTQGILQERDCAAQGDSCGYVNEEIGWFCR